MGFIRLIGAVLVQPIYSLKIIIIAFSFLSLACGQVGFSNLGSKPVNDEVSEIIDDPKGPNDSLPGTNDDSIDSDTNSGGSGSQESDDGSTSDDADDEGTGGSDDSNHSDDSSSSDDGTGDSGTDGSDGLGDDGSDNSGMDDSGDDSSGSSDDGSSEPGDGSSDGSGHDGSSDDSGSNDGGSDQTGNDDGSVPNCDPNLDYIDNGDFEVVDDRQGIQRKKRLDQLDRAKWDVYTELPSEFEDRIVSWFKSEDTAGIEVEYSGTVVPAASGNHYVELDSHGKNSNSGMNQDVELQAGSYQISFFYRPRRNKANDNGIDLYFNESLVVSLNETDTSQWMEVSYDFSVAEDQVMRVRFQATGIENSYGGFLDGISLFRMDCGASESF